MLLRSIHNSTEFAFEAWTNIYQTIKFCDGNIAPVWNLDISLNIAEVNLGIIIDSVNDMGFDCEWLCVLFFVNYCVDALDLASFIVIAKV